MDCVLPTVLCLSLMASWPSVSSQQQSLASCYRRQCDQLIVGRQLRYERALEIINNEEYLTAADLDLLRRRRLFRFKRQTEEESTTRPTPDDNETTTTAGPENITTTTTSPSLPLAPVAVTTGVVSLGGLAYMLLPPGPPILTPPLGVAPPDVPQPGQLGGGAPPVANSPTAAEALSLVPAGAVPVAIFPPFLLPRTLPAIAVIFSEPNFDNAIQSRLGYPRSRFHKVFKTWHQKAQRKRGLFQRMSRFLDMVFRKRQMKERNFGFVVKVTLVDEMCQLGVTCNINGHFINATAGRRQTGEEFSSTAPPDCRTTFVGCNP